MIRFHHLVKRFGSIAAVDDLTFEVAPGEVYALLGPNGAGKTTALRCLAALLRPTSGTVTLDGIDVASQPLEARRRLGFLSTSMGLYERLTGREVLTYFGRLHGLEEEAIRASIAALSEVFALEPFIDRRCGEISSGQRQRIALARSIVHDPPALVLDEPTSGLDVLSGEGVYAFIEEERGRGKAILFSTHQMAEVDLLADRVGVLVAGRLVSEGTPREVVEAVGAENLTRAFIRLAGGRPREAWARARVGRPGPDPVVREGRE